MSSMSEDEFRLRPKGDGPSALEKSSSGTVRTSARISVRILSGIESMHMVVIVVHEQEGRLKRNQLT